MLNKKEKRTPIEVKAQVLLREDDIYDSNSDSDDSNREENSRILREVCGNKRVGESTQ